MSQPFNIHLPLEVAYKRDVLFALELLDAVTLTRVSQDVTVKADGLNGKPIVNASGFFVWLKEQPGTVNEISIDPGVLPYESVTVPASQVTLPLTTVELQPRVSYPFAAGITGLRGTMIEAVAVLPDSPTPVGDAEVYLRWLDENGIWRDSPTKSKTDKKRGDFVSILRLAPTEKPDLQGSAVTVRLRVIRNGNERGSTDFQLQQGRITDPTTLNPLTFAWDDLLP